MFEFDHCYRLHTKECFGAAGRCQYTGSRHNRGRSPEKGKLFKTPGDAHTAGDKGKFGGDLGVAPSRKTLLVTEINQRFWLDMNQP